MGKFDLDENISTLFGIGRYSKIPGTLGSAAALIIVMIMYVAGFRLHWSAIIAVIIIGTWCSDRYSRKTGIKDPPEVVIDEVAGMWISIYLLPPNNWIPAFVVFRIVDIVKPFPINKAEKLPGGIGIMADDIAGGIIVNLIFIAVRAYLIPSL
ncbi:MAG: phosphatidylglycerophosphatase A [Synergistaceae bacterium]|nr:phosphatidylglycerophosphatase A [Synergistaceae bacterium]